MNRKAISSELQGDMDKVRSLQKLTEFLINMRILPLRKELGNLDESETLTKEAIKTELKKIEAEFLTHCKEMENICKKNGWKFQIVTGQYINPPS